MAVVAPNAVAPHRPPALVGELVNSNVNDQFAPPMITSTFLYGPISGQPAGWMFFATFYWLS